MPDPSHPRSFPSSKPEKQETTFDETETIDVTYKKPSRFQEFVFAKIIMQDKNLSIKNDEEIIKPLLSSFNLSRIETNTVEDMSSQSTLKFKKPSFLNKLFGWIRLPKFGFFGSKKMSDKQPGRPMKYPYTFTAKVAQFPWKYHINNSWMWKYYFIALAVSFPVFYKLSRASNTPENKKVWEEIRRREFTPGGHH